MLKRILLAALAALMACSCSMARGVPSDDQIRAMPYYSVDPAADPSIGPSAAVWAVLEAASRAGVEFEPDWQQGVMAQSSYEDGLSSWDIGIVGNAPQYGSEPATLYGSVAGGDGGRVAVVEYVWVLYEDSSGDFADAYIVPRGEPVTILLQ